MSFKGSNNRWALEDDHRVVMSSFYWHDGTWNSDERTRQNEGIESWQLNCHLLSPEAFEPTTYLLTKSSKSFVPLLVRVLSLARSIQPTNEGDTTSISSVCILPITRQTLVTDSRANIDRARTFQVHNQTSSLAS